VTGPVEGPHTPIGWARAGVAVALEDGQLVVTGEIADGYLDRPFSAYATGDLARQRADGAFVYLGRADSQVQVRGNRVELGEVEHVLCDHPGVRHAVVVQREDGRLHAMVEGQAPPQELRGWLAERLPAFMVPHTWERTDALPRTAAGKRDRSAVGVSSALSRLGLAWADVLGLDAPPGPDDDFFALGGDSLTLLDVLDRVRTEGSALSPLPLYERSTLARMASYLSGSTAPEAPSRPASLSPGERGFLLAHADDPAHPPIWTARVPVRGPLHPDAFRRALQTVVDRHPMLRATWSENQRSVVDRAAVPLQYDDLSCLPVAVRERAREARWEEEGAAVLDPAVWPAWRVRLVRVDAELHEIILAVHHVVADAGSAWILTDELLAAHDGVLSRPVPPAYEEVAPAVGALDPWWDQALAGLTQGAAPPRTTEVSRGFSIDAVRWARIAARAVTPYAAMATATLAALQVVLGTDDVLLSTAVSGRPTGALGTVGPFARALPVRVTEPATPSVVAAALASAGAHADAPLWQLAAAAGGLRRLGRFFLTWLDPRTAGDRVDWPGGRYHFATRSTDTEVLVGGLVSDGLHVHVHGGDAAGAVADVLERLLREMAEPDAALVVYPPADLAVPIAQPVAIEQVDASLATSELVLLPMHVEASDALDAAVDAAIRHSPARVVALAGMLPALTGLGTRSMGRADQVVTTGHAATVVAMVLTIQRVLAETGRDWAALRVGMLGYGAIGRATHELAMHVLGAPREVQIEDPRLPGSRTLDVDLILGATSGGAAIDVAALMPGTLVIDDSFPRAFDDAAARTRMLEHGDVLLVGGGMLDVGPLRRWSPFPGADALRDRYGAAWLPGCHAEAVLLAARPELGPTVGPVDLPRALAVWKAVGEVGWQAAPLHLGGWLVPVAGMPVSRG
jgi:aryl carrier-like protein